MTTSHRRLEASKFSWEQLTESQQRAVERVAEIMVEAVDALGNSKAEVPKAEAMLPRHSQLAFVDGERGTGKTSVLLTVRALTRPNPPDKAGLPGAVQRLIEKRQRFHWLETLDMEPIRRGINLFAAIFARLEAASGGQISSRLPLAAALDEHDPYEQFVADLGDLRISAVFAWDGSNANRAECQDLEAYASDVLRQEQAALTIDKRLDKALESLAKLPLQACDPPNRNPLFVLPVDDFDLAPTRCLEMLRIIRALWSPRLFFLICGSERGAEQALILKNEGEFARLVPGHLSHQSHEWVGIVRQAGFEIAAANLRKLLPPQQRAHLERITLRQALARRVAAGEPGADAFSLRSALQGLRFDVNTNPAERQGTTAERFLLLDETWPIQNSSAACYLGGTPRQIHDTAMLIAGLGEEQVKLAEETPPDRWAEKQNEFQDRILSSLSRAICDDVRETILIKKDREPLLQAAEFRDGAIRLRDAVEVEIEFRRPHHEPDASSDGDAPSEEVRPSRLLRADFAELRWTLRSSRNHKSSGRPLSPRLTAGLTLLHDVAMSLWGGYLPGRSLVPSPTELRTIRREDSPSNTWIATVLRLDHGSLPLPWPTPTWTTFRQVECFDSIWRNLSNTWDPVDLGAAWIEAMLRTVFDEPFAPPKDRPNWEYVYKTMSALIKEKPVRYLRMTLRWSTLEAIARLCAPEYHVFTADDVEKLAKKCGQFAKAIKEPEVARTVRKRRGEIWRAVYVSESHGPDAFRVWTAVHPKFAAKKLDALQARGAAKEKREFETLDKIVNDAACREHPLNAKWNLTPRRADVDDSDI